MITNANVEYSTDTLRLTMIDFERAIARLPQVESFPGLPAAWRWYRAPRWYGALAVSDDGGHAFEMRGLDSFDEGLVRAVLMFARVERLSKVGSLVAVLDRGPPDEHHGRCRLRGERHSRQEVADENHRGLAE